jgi:hypothetical protein
MAMKILLGMIVGFGIAFDVQDVTDSPNPNE